MQTPPITNRKSGVVLPGAVVAVSIIAMIAVPAMALDGPRPTRLGWQMYSGLYIAPEVTVETADGSVLDRPLEDIVAAVRPWPDYVDAVSRHLCETEPDAVAVRFFRADPAVDEVTECAKS